MKVKDILKITNGYIISENKDENIECINFSKDTREINKNDVYVALKGEKFDGNDFYNVAIDNGAKVCIVSKNVASYKDSIIIKVEDTLQALQQIAKYKREENDIPVVAVTGSVGKTSTKDLIASVISTKYNTLKTKGNYNNEIGLPLTILRLQNEEIMVTEMGMNHFGEISKLTQIAKPTIAVITNIGTAHIGNLGSQENILKAKLEILEGLQGNIVIINNDDKLLHNWAENNKEKYNIITYGIKNKSDYMAENIKFYENKSEFNIKNKKVVVPVAGEHFVLNSLCSIAVGSVLNIDIDNIIKGIANLELSNKRMEIIKNKNGAIVINDTYNANFDSMRAAINYLKKLNNRRKIAVLGDMLELGEYSKELHEKVGEEIDNNIDILITVGKEAKNISIKAKAKAKFEFHSNKEAINKIKSIICEKDAILLKASNGMKFIEIVEEIIK